MKKLLFAIMILAGHRTLAQNDFVEEIAPPARQAVRALVDFGPELTTVTEQVKAKFDAGKTNESDLSEDLASTKDLILKYLNNGKREQLAQLYLLYAHIYADGLHNISRGRAIWTQIARDFPSTSAAKTARDLLSKPEVNSAIIITTNISEQLNVAQNANEFSEADSAAKSNNNYSKKPTWEWNYKTIVTAYEKTGRTNPKWDDSAKKALNAYVRTRVGANLGVEEQTIVTNCQAAIATGCDDSMISFLNTQYVLARQDLEPEKFEAPLETPGNKLASAFCESARKLNESQYPPIRKFYGNFEASIYLNRSNKKTHDPHIASEARHFEDLAVSNLVIALKDKTMPPKQICDDCKWLLCVFQGDPIKLKDCYILMEPELSTYHDKWVGLFVKGWFYINTAWQSRGNDYADKVTAQGWIDFSRRLDIAEKALDEAWELNSNEVRIATAMLTLELGQGKGRERLEMWFKRAMDLNPDTVAACEAKRYYLEPKWYGSQKEMMTFCQDCLNSKTWGGKVPLILVREYESILLEQERYDFRGALKSTPGVFAESKPLPDDLKDNFSWDEVQQAYKKYFKKYPSDIIERQRFVFLAGRTHHWRDVNEQLPYIGNVHSVEIFGHDFVYKQIVSQAQQFLHQKIPPPRILPQRLNQGPVKIGDTITIEAKAVKIYIPNGDENNLVIPNYYQWRLNGTNLPNATNSSYIIEHASPQDAGEYTVIVTNLGGSVTGYNGMLWVRDQKKTLRKPTPSMPLDLRSDKAVPTNSPIQTTIEEGPPTFVNQPMGHKVKTGRRISFIATVRKNVVNKSPIGIQWRLNGKDIIDTTNSASETVDWVSVISARHFIKSVSPDDVGNYSVVITNSFGSVTSSNAMLTVDTP